MNKILFLGMISLLLISCGDNDGLTPAPIKLKKSEVTVEAQATEVNIQVNHPYWRFAGLNVTDSLHNGENILEDFTSDPLIGDWYKITEKDNRKYLSIQVDENKEKQRSIQIGLDSGGTGTNFTLIQKGAK